MGTKQGKSHKEQINVEAKAKELSIALEWRTASFFESKFVATENEVFSKHFFTLDKSIFVLIQEQQKHTVNIFSKYKQLVSPSITKILKLIEMKHLKENKRYTTGNFNFKWRWWCRKNSTYQKII